MKMTDVWRLGLGREVKPSRVQNTGKLIWKNDHEFHFLWNKFKVPMILLDGDIKSYKSRVRKNSEAELLKV
jgi:hypothetical protein